MIFTLSFLLLPGGCSDTTGPQQGDQEAIRGLVLGAHGVPFGFEFERLDEMGDPVATSTITRSVLVRAFSSGSEAVAASGWVEIDEQQGATVNLQFGK